MPPLIPPPHLVIESRQVDHVAVVTLHAHGGIDSVWAVSADLHGAVFRVALGPCYLRRGP